MRLRLLTFFLINSGKNNGFPFLDILGYLKNTHKNPKFGRVRQVPIRELAWEFPGWDNRRAFCTRMRQYGLSKCHRSATEAFSVNCLRSVPAFAGRFLELNDVYWVLHSTNMFFKVASLSPLRGQSFLS